MAPGFWIEPEEFEEAIKDLEYYTEKYEKFKEAIKRVGIEKAFKLMEEVIEKWLAIGKTRDELYAALSPLLGIQGADFVIRFLRLPSGLGELKALEELEKEGVDKEIIRRFQELLILYGWRVMSKISMSEMSEKKATIRPDNINVFVVEIRESDRRKKYVKLRLTGPSIRKSTSIDIIDIEISIQKLGWILDSLAKVDEDIRKVIMDLSSKISKESIGKEKTTR